MTNDADMRALSASEVACYKWPEDTAEHKALRAAFVEGAHLGAPAQSVNEPVAWRYKHSSHREWSYSETEPEGPSIHLFKVEPLYAGPLPPQERTCGHCGRDEECDDEQRCPLSIPALQGRETVADEMLENGTADAFAEAHYATLYQEVADSGTTTVRELHNIPEAFCQEIARLLRAVPQSQEVTTWAYPDERSDLIDAKENFRAEVQRLSALVEQYGAKISKDTVEIDRRGTLIDELSAQVERLTKQISESCLDARSDPELGGCARAMMAEHQVEKLTEALNACRISLKNRDRGAQEEMAYTLARIALSSEKLPDSGEVSATDRNA